LFKIKKRQQETNSKKEALLKPFTVLSELIRTIFDDKGIKITDNLSLGDATTAILSDKLSAGEKQMLSFLCYCMFAQDTVIFIDEPELSLHPDWQRLLMPTLLEIAPTNQFFIATHSPFIYAKYPDKEIILDQDKGGI
jgi:predicted ATPase